MGADFYLRQGDTLPSITATLKDGAGNVVDLTDASAVRFHMRRVEGGPAVTNGPAVIVDAPTGAVRYDWLPADTAVAGDFYAEWEVTFTDQTVLSFMNNAYLLINITAQLA